MKNYNKKIGAYLAKERKAKKLSQNQVAEKMDVTKTAISYWETGKRVINADQMLNYCEVLGVDPQDLVREVTSDASL